MRLWSIHPEFLDAKGLVALWREGLLAQAVLRGRTRGYLRHPQLERFRTTASPTGAVAEYLRGVLAEAESRGYRFDASRIGPDRFSGTLPVHRGQVAYERTHLLAKLEVRDPERWERLQGEPDPSIHPLFHGVAGGVEDWERV